MTPTLIADFASPMRCRVRFRACPSQHVAQWRSNFIAPRKKWAAEINAGADTHIETRPDFRAESGLEPDQALPGHRARGRHQHGRASTKQAAADHQRRFEAS